MARLEIRGLRKSFGQIEAVKGVSLECNDEEFFVLLGPSGAGKTTMLKMIAGIEEADGGEIILDGKRINDEDPQNRDIAMAFEDYALYPHFTVYENLAFPLRSPRRKEKMSQEMVESRVSEVAGFLKIQNLLDRPPHQLSGGQRQRVGLGRALVRVPTILLLDEPIAHLDAKLRHEMRGALKRLQRKTKVTTIYATPDSAEALGMADRIAFVLGGEILQLGTTEELYHHPQNEFIAQFVSDIPINIFPCEVRDENGSVVLKSEHFECPAPNDVKPKLNSVKGTIHLGIRANAIRVGEAEKEGDLQIKGEVFVTEPLGSFTIITVKVGDRIIKAKSEISHRFDMGDQIHLTAESESFFIFDGSTGETLLTGKM